LKIRFSFFFALALILIVIQNAAAHYTFIMPEKFRVAPGDTVKIGFHSADSFPDSTALAKRLSEASLHAAGKTVAIAMTEDGKRMVGNATIANGGYVIATVVNAASIEDMKAESFTKYLKEEGLHNIVDARATSSETDKPARERYTMWAKSILLAGAPNEDYKQPVGLPIEIVPEKDPAALKAGESLPVRVLFRGAPAKGLEVMATSASLKSHSIGKTDAAGRISVPVTPGAWRLHTIFMERSSKEDADWESFWATLTFEVR
jgi:uncharacterized GH25 family protein